MVLAWLSDKVDLIGPASTTHLKMATSTLYVTIVSITIATIRVPTETPLASLNGERRNSKVGSQTPACL